MELFQEILLEVFRGEEIQISFPNLKTDLKEILETRSYQVIQKIKAVLEDDSLKDPTCFKKIEEIVQIYERLGSNEEAE